MKIRRAAANREMPWKNGGGTTYEIASSPAGSSIENFDWRISRALVTQRGPFSAFPGIDRNLSVLSGHLTLMNRDGKRIDLLPDSMPFAFPGEIGIDGTPQGDAPVMDFNVMTRRGRYRSFVTRGEIEEPTSFRDIEDTTLVLVETGQLFVAGQAGSSLKPLDCLLLEAGDTVVVENVGDAATVLLAELLRV